MRIVNTHDELDALPDWSYIRDADGAYVVVFPESFGMRLYYRDQYDVSESESVTLPATILYVPA